MKYFILGALASGFLLYGLSMMYGATGTLDIPTVFEAIHKGTVNPQVLTFGHTKGGNRKLWVERFKALGPAADGVIVTGQGSFNQANITGESLPVDKKPGDDVFAGTQNLTGVLEIRVSRAGLPGERRTVCSSV